MKPQKINIKRKILKAFREEKTDYPQRSIIRMTELSPQGKRKIFPDLQANYL